MPTPRVGPAQEDHLSDTGSDEEVDDADADSQSYTMPTMQMARSLFTESDEAAGAGTDSATNDVVGTKAAIMRDRTQLQLESDLRAIRSDMGQLLPRRVATIDRAVVQPRHKFGWWRDDKE